MTRIPLAVIAGISAVTLSVLPAVPASAAAPSKPRPVPATAAASIDFDTVRVDRQDDVVLIRVTGVNSRAPITVNWGDDGGLRRARVNCSPATAARTPDRCAATLKHYYSTDGTYTVVVKAGTATIATKQVTIVPAPLPWSPPAGWTQPAGWALLTGSATYVPCSTVTWHLERSSEPADRSTMREDITAALAAIATHTGLTFTETTGGASAGLTFTYDNFGSGGPAGVGGPLGSGGGAVTFNNASEWTKNDWAGLGTVVKEWDEGGLHWTWVMPGRGWLVVHEVMHALGLDHINDPTQIMNPTSGAVAFGPGDIDGLRTMYLNNPCPAIP